jgi:lysophospholipase L1-like esterase
MKKIRIILCIMSCALCIENMAQPLMRQLPHYDCVNYDANKLILKGDSNRLSTFFAKLDSLALWGDNEINIVHIGGSHIQAGVFPNRMRMNFSNILPGFSGERGAIFPYSAARTNNPKNFEIHYSGEWKKCQNSRPPVTETLGMMGYTISTNDLNCSIGFNLNPEEFGSNWKFNKLRLFATIGDKDLMPILVVNGDTVPSVYEDSTFVFYLNNFAENGTIALGKISDFDRLYNKYNSQFINIKDSIQDSLSLELEKIYNNKDSVQTLNSYQLDIGLESDNIQNPTEEYCTTNTNWNFSIMGILPENNFNGITYHSMGVNGASLQSWLRCEKFEKQMAFIKPDLAIMAVGVNDANVEYGKFSKETFKARYNQLLQKIYAANPNCAVIFITNNDCVVRVGRRSYGLNKNTALVQQAMHELAEQHNAAVWDLYEIMGGLGSISVWNEAGLANKDRVHFLVPGYNLLGDMLYNAIIYEWLYKN